jgi:hypothetical protein
MRTGAKAEKKKMLIKQAHRASSAVRALCEKNAGRIWLSSLSWPGFVPAIHVLTPLREVVDARHKAGHDISRRGLPACARPMFFWRISGILILPKSGKPDMGSRHAVPQLFLLALACAAL